MPKTPTNIIKDWFRTGLKPTQNQFWNWLDSFFHKDDKIPLESVEGLQEIVNSKAEQEALQGEIDNRIAADVALNQRIDTETSDRIADDNALNQRIDTEITDRTAADEELQQNIDTEITDRIDADNALNQRIDTEITERTEADNALSQRIDTEITNRTEADNALNQRIDTKINIGEKGEPEGVATLDVSGKVPSSQLPSYVDDVLEFGTFDDLPSEGETGKIYVTIDTRKTYRWTGSEYIDLNPVDLSDYYNKPETDQKIISAKQLIEVAAFTDLPTEGEAEKVYLTQDENKLWRWDGTEYVLLSGSSEPAKFPFIFDVLPGTYEGTLSSEEGLFFDKFGSVDNFKNLVKKIHETGSFVIRWGEFGEYQYVNLTAATVIHPRSGEYHIIMFISIPDPPFLSISIDESRDYYRIIIIDAEQYRITDKAKADLTNVDNEVFKQKGIASGLGGGGSLSPANSGYGIEVTEDGKINKTTLYNEDTYFLYYSIIFIYAGFNNSKIIQNVSDESNVLNYMFGGVASFIDTCEKIKKGYDYRTFVNNTLVNIEFYNVIIKNGLYSLGYNIYHFESGVKYNSNVYIMVDISEDSIEITINGYRKVQESLSELNNGNGIIISPEVELTNESDYIPPKIAIDESIVATHQSVDQKISTRFAQTSAQGSAVMYYRYTGGTYQLSPAKPTTNENAPFSLVGTALTARTFSGTLTGAGTFNPKASYVKVFNLTGLRAESTYTIKCDYTLKGIAIYTETRTFATANNETSRLFEFVIPSESTYATPFTFAAGDSVQEVISISCSNGNNHTVNLANVISTNNYSFTQRNGGVVYADEVFDAALNKTQEEINASAGNAVDWNTITNKPTAFTPSAHNQDWSTITNKPIIPTISWI